MYMYIELMSIQMCICICIKNRMRVLHPDVVTDDVVRDASASIRTGDVRSMQRVLDARRTRLLHTLSMLYTFIPY